MPSATRGSILISTANDIGEALVEKLGGVGYSPNEWKEKYNLCGIAPVDSAPALSVLSDSAGTGDERGSILIATADAIGAILNKKYNVLRGFKPKEWASACRKMKALEEGSVASASIASFSDGADTVPLTSCVCNIDANLDGKSAVNAVHTRKNLVNSSLNEQGSINATTGANVNSNTRIRTAYIKINANTTYSISIGGSVNLFELYQYKTDGTLARAYIAINAQTYTFTSHADAVSIRFSMRYADNSVIQTSAIENLQLEQSSEPTTYEAYSAETKTADLGRTIYGGSADIITGEGTDENGNDFTFEPVKIDSFPGVNNIWNDCGNTAVGYYKAPTPYTRKTATGGIANFSDQRTDLPLTKAIANIAPSIAGKSAVNLYQGKKNLVALNLSPDHATVENGVTINTQTSNTLNMTTTGVAYACERLFYTLRAGTYTARFLATSSDSFAPKVALYKYPSGSVLTSSFASNEAKTFALTEETVVDIRLFASGNADTAIRTVEFTNFQLEVGSSASTYEQYQAPTTYAAELGETVYGGSVDFVSGTKSVSFARVDMGSLTWQYDSANTRFFTVDLTSVIKRGSSGWITDLAVDPTYTVASGTANDKTISEYATTGYIYIKDTDYTDPIAFKASLSGKYLTYPLSTPTESTIPGRVISPIEGVNNYWNDAGGDTEIQYFENET